MSSLENTIELSRCKHMYEGRNTAVPVICPADLKRYPKFGAPRKEFDNNAIAFHALGAKVHAITNSQNPVRLNQTGWGGIMVRGDNGLVCVDILEPTAYPAPQHTHLGRSPRPPVPHTRVQPSQLASQVLFPLQARVTLICWWAGIIYPMPAPQRRHGSSSSPARFYFLDLDGSLLYFQVTTAINRKYFQHAVSLEFCRCSGTLS